MKPFVFFLFFLGGFAFLPFVNGQESSSAGPGNRYFEDMLLYTDRDVYISGERIWFKLLCFGPGGQTENVLSKIAYVEVYDQQFNSIARGKFRITNGMTTGFLGIPSSINSGNYYIRAYSQYMLNYPCYLYPSSLLSVVNPDKPLFDGKNTFSDEITIVPEGGRFIAGIASKLAVRISPVLCKTVSGMAVVDNHGREVSHANPLANGLALFEMTPDSAVQYSLKILLNDSSVIQKSLPPVSGDGMIMKSDFTGDVLKISLCTGKQYGPILPIGCTVEVRSGTYERLITRTIGPGNDVTIRADQLDSGIIYLLLKDENKEIIDIQSTYIPGSTKQEIGISMNKTVFKPRELVDMNISVQENIINRGHSLISAALAGTRYPHKDLLPSHIAYNPVLLPNYLKNIGPESDSLKKQINMALILYSEVFSTAAFKESIEKEATLEYLPEIRDAGISGKVIEKKSGKPLANVMVYAAVIGNAPQLHIYRTKADGKFFLTLNHLSGMHPVYLCPKLVDSMELELQVNVDFSNEYPRSAGLIPFDIDSADHQMLDRLYLNSQINKAFIRHTEKSMEKPVYYPLTGTAPEYSILLKDFIEMPVMEEVFTEITPFVSVRRRDSHYYLSVYDEKAHTTYDDPTVLLDGIPVFDLDQIMKISPELVAKIDVTNKVTYLGEHTLGGLISIRTHTNNFAGIAFPDASEFIEYQAVTDESYPEFPNHEESDIKDHDPDFRNLLYWNPFIVPEGKSSKLRFYTSDHCNDYEIVFRSYDGLTHYYGNARMRVAGNRK